MNGSVMKGTQAGGGEGPENVAGVFNRLEAVKAWEQKTGKQDPSPGAHVRALVSV